MTWNLTFSIRAFDRQTSENSKCLLDILYLIITDTTFKIPYSILYVSHQNYTEILFFVNGPFYIIFCVQYLGCYFRKDDLLVILAPGTDIGIHRCRQGLFRSGHCRWIMTFDLPCRCLSPLLYLLRKDKMVNNNRTTHQQQVSALLRYPAT